MKKINIAFASYAAVLVLLLIAGMITWYKGLSEQLSIADESREVAGVFSESDKKDLPLINIKPSFYDEDILEDTIRKNASTAKDDNIMALVSPHHFLAADLIASALAMASSRDIENIIIIGPNHDSIGNETFSTVKASWQTPFGNLNSNAEMVDSFMFDMGILSKIEAFENEHAIGSLAIIAKHYFPKAELLPILISSSAKEGDARKLAAWLSENIGKNDLVVFSMDFSHYLTKTQADSSDEYTKKLIYNLDIEKISQLNDDFVDSPISLAASLIYAENKGLKTEIMRNSNSFDLSSVKSDSTTSYFTIKFSK